jgi:dTDP-4-dehydrorhamnose 3,5-epimerase
MNTFIPITKIKGAYLIERNLHKDSLGSSDILYCNESLKEKGMSYMFPKINLFGSHNKGTLRGVYLRKNPYEENKIVTCVRGAIYNVVVDLRDKKNIQWEGFCLTEGDGKSLFIPKGVAHGYLTMTNDTSILELVDQDYASDTITGVRWDDPKIGIVWPFSPIIISEMDNSFDLL